MHNDASLSLEHDVEDLAAHAAALLREFHGTLSSTSPVAAFPVDEELLAEAVRPPGALPGEAKQLLNFLAHAATASQQSMSPRFVAHVPSGGLPSSAVAQFLAGGLNPYTAIPYQAPVLVAMEQQLMRWLCDLFGLDAGATGTMTTGSSLAMLSAVVAARHNKVGDDLSKATAYVGANAHHCAAKALRIAGIPAARVRVVPADPYTGMDPAATARMIADDRADGLHPFLLIATAGSTGTGAIDTLPALGSLARERDLWFHVDAAYGGGFQLTFRGRWRLAGVDTADSINLDAHKSLFLPTGTGILLVNDAETLHSTYAEPAPYLTDVSPSTAFPVLADLGMELSREFRAPRLWLPLHLHGTDFFRDALDRMLDLALYAHTRLSSDPRLETGPLPTLSIVTFRLRDVDEHGNREFLRAVNATGRASMSSIELDGYWLRLCLLNQRIRTEHVDELIDTVTRVADGRR